MAERLSARSSYQVKRLPAAWAIHHTNHGQTTLSLLAALQPERLMALGSESAGPRLSLGQSAKRRPVVKEADSTIQSTSSRIFSFEFSHGTYAYNTHDPANLWV
jgi:hypothetical protein